MLRISKLADYATIIMVRYGQNPAQSLNAKEISDMMQIGQATISKILKLLAKANLLTSQRGTKGGYQLSRSPDQINMAEIVAAIDGSIALTECSQDHSNCELQKNCSTHDGWQIINQTVFKALSTISLANMVSKNFEAKLHFIPRNTSNIEKISIKKVNAI